MMQHPFHLHGHKFFVVASGSLMEAEEARLAAPNERPPYMDSMSLPPQRFVVLRVNFDNPGPWLFHCHTGFHLARGMATGFIVGTPAQQPMPPAEMSDACPMGPAAAEDRGDAEPNDGGLAFLRQSVLVAMLSELFGSVVGYLAAHAVRRYRTVGRKHPYLVVEEQHGEEEEEEEEEEGKAKTATV